MKLLTIPLNSGHILAADIMRYLLIRDRLYIYIKKKKKKSNKNQKLRVITVDNEKNG